jgi:prephenate dehydrogenase
MKYRVIKIRPENDCTREFLSKYRYIVEAINDSGMVVYATPIKSLEEFWQDFIEQYNLELVVSC